MTTGVILFSFLAGLIQADTASPWPYQHVDKNAKLSNSAITSVYLDKYDQVWLGTWDGLDRYDGSSIRVYKPDPYIKGTISNNVVRDFLEDGRGNLWVVTHQGINKYNRDTDSFDAYFETLSDIPFLENNIRACIGGDSAVWTSVVGKGISRYSFKEKKFKPVSFQGVDKKWLSSVVNLGHHGGLLYMLGNDGRLVCTVDTRLVYGKQVLNPGEIKYHKFLRFANSYYLAIANSTGKLWLFDLADIEKEPIAIPLANAVSSLSRSLNLSAIWIGTEAGDVYRVVQKGGKITWESMNSSFPNFSKIRIKILTITETKQDLVWVGTDGDGVYKFLTRPKTFYSVLPGSPDAGQLSHSIVRSVYEDDAGTLYVGTRGGGLNIVSPDRARTKILNTRNGLSNDAVLAVNQDHHGNLWVGQDGEGIDMVESGTGKIFHFPRDFENSPELMFSSVYSICVDAFNDIWLGTSGYGVIHFKVSRTNRGKYRLEEFDRISHESNTPETAIKSNIVYSIVEEKPNTLWFGTRGGGIYRYNSLAKQIEEHIEANANDKVRLCNNDVLSLFIDHQEQLWIGTSGGLNRLFLQSKPYRVNQYTEHEGLSNNTIHGILDDPKNNIWISTNRGLLMYDQDRNTFKNFDTNDGLQNNEFTDGAVFRSRKSPTLYFGGIDGLDIVYPDKLNVMNYFPRLTVTDFQVRNVSVAPDDGSGILKENVDFVDNIELKHDQNFISFSFTTLDYWNKQKSEYAYFLENFDKDWNYIGQQQSISLTNIPPGHYKLNINFTNENGAWSPSPRVISITVTPPFWRTSWAYAFYIFLAIAVQTCLVLYILWRMRVRKAMAMDKFKAHQLKELNDYKLQFFTNIAHEFRTPLTLILGPVTSLLNKSHDGNEKKQLKTIYSNSLRLQKLIEELIQFRKIESGKDKLELSTIDLVPFAQEVIESFQQHADDREVHLEFYPEPEALMAYVDSKKIEKILINLISNAIKYSAKEGMVSVYLKEVNGYVVFAVRDEGVGISDENKEKIFESFYHNPAGTIEANGLAKSTGIGLSLTKSLVLMHQGQIKVESKPGKGSTFTVTIPIRKEAYPNQPEQHIVLPPSTNLHEKVSLEFETDHYLLDQPEKVAHTVLSKRPYSLLVVDDNAQITSLLENILSDKYVIYKTSNGKKAMTILEEERIDLVISDILMPDMDGLTLCKLIKENIQTSHIPVILLTAKVEIENRIQGLQVGADSYIPKPFHPEHLFIRIEKLIERMELIRKRFKDFGDAETVNLAAGIGERDDIFFLKITQCIQAHLGEPEFNADTIADDVGMSKASLYKKVKTITGLTPHGLIKQYRLKKAADLLRNSDMSVSEVIYETGFNSRSYFYKSFNEMFHCHPKDFNSMKNG